MSFRGHSRLRGWAVWLVVLALLAPGGVSAGSGCGVCPSDCPMHHAVAAAVPDMPCHRAETSRAEDGPVLQAACGQRDALDLGVQLRDRSVAVCVGVNDLRADRGAPVRPDPPRFPDADVPTPPPQDVRSV